MDKNKRGELTAPNFPTAKEDAKTVAPPSRRRSSSLSRIGSPSTRKRCATSSINGSVRGWEMAA